MSKQEDSAYPPPPPPNYAAPPPAGQQPQASMAPPPQQQQSTVIIQAGHMAPGQIFMFTDAPMNMQCPHCQAQIITRTERKMGTMVWLVAGVMILLGLWLCCCLIPFCIPSLYDVAHYCPNCSRHLGTKQRLH